MLSQVITFLIALAVVWGFGWKPIVKMIDERKEKIRSSLESAEAAQQKITKLEADYRAKLELVEQKTAELIMSAKQDANRAKEDIMRVAQAEAAALRKKSQEQLEQDRASVMGSMRAEIIGLSMAIAEKALAQPVADAVHARKYEQILDELSHDKSWRPA
jgi:F-type H+-transporting ATPase subunit b